MRWYRAGVLTRLVTVVNRIWPGRDKKSDGSIGDAAHQKTKSDHNPDPASKPPGVVRAQDLDKDGIRVPVVLAALLLHASTLYLIYNRVIYARSRRFRRARYTGKNPHTGHLHASIRKGYENSAEKFVFLDYAPNWSKGIKAGATNGAARQVQAMLIASGYTLTLDGKFGPVTTSALKRYQAKRKLTVDGIAGPKTLAAFLGK